MIKTVSKVGIEGTYLNIRKAIYKNPQRISSLMDKTKSFSSTVRNKTGMSTLTTVV